MSNEGLEDARQVSEKLLKSLEGLEANPGREVDMMFEKGTQYLKDYAQRTGDEKPVRVWVELFEGWRQTAAKSMDFAKQRINSYQGYIEVLEKIQDVSTEEDVKRAIADLRAFREHNPTEIPREVAESFIIIAKRVAEFAHVFQFPDLVPVYEFIANSMKRFSDIWDELYGVSMKFTDILNTLMNVTSPPEFRARTKLAREVAIPVFEGLRKYLESF